MRLWRARAITAEEALDLVMRPKRGFFQVLGGFARSKPLGAIGAVLVILLILVAIFADRITTKEPSEISANVTASPGADAWMGTDDLGRDVFSRVVHGSRISLRVGFLSVAIGVSVGFVIGLGTAYFGGKVDLFVQRIMDAILAFPGLVLILAIVTILEPSINNVIYALSFGMIPRSARTIRSQALSIKETDYVLAARAVGARDWRIILRHMAPNCLATYIVFATFSLGFAIVAEASLSFLGLGVPPSVPTWGGMVNGATRTGIDVVPWLGVFPGLALATIVFGANLLGDALRDLLDPRLRGTN